MSWGGLCFLVADGACLSALRACERNGSLRCSLALPGRRKGGVSGRTGRGTSGAQGASCGAGGRWRDSLIYGIDPLLLCNHLQRDHNGITGFLTV